MEAERQQRMREEVVMIIKTGNSRMATHQQHVIESLLGRAQAAEHELETSAKIISDYRAELLRLQPAQMLPFEVRHLRKVCKLTRAQAF